MSDDGKMIVDVSRIKRLMTELDTTKKENTKAFRTAFRQSAGVIQKQAKRNLKAITLKRGPLKSANLLQFVRVAAYKTGRGAHVTILPDQRRRTDARLAKKGLSNHSFLLRFFEQGTGHRFTETKTRKKVRTGTPKRRNYRGRIPPSMFFDNAVKAKQKEAENNVEKAIIAQIKKVVSKRK